MRSRQKPRGRDRGKTVSDSGGELPNQRKSQWRNPFVRHVIVFFSTGLYSGYSPIAPGTAGTMVAVPLYLVLSRLPVFSYGLTVVAFVVMSCWFSGAAESIFLKKDSERIVIDEISGFLVTMGFLPTVPLYVLLGFFLFRFFDIIKPYPTKRLETLKGGYGVVADDVVAGIYSNLALHICIFLIERKAPLWIF